ncbi:MAG: HAMP domain-containing protein [Clostridia bacterium]|nr:HAMP domain-containing protein [Clostridia bacterium]
MKRSILKNMILGSTLVVLMTFLIIVLVFSKYLETNAVNQRAEILKNSVPRISEISALVFANPTTNMNIIYKNVIDTMCYNMDASMIVFSKDGRIITVSGLSKNRYINKTLEPELYESIIKGKEITEVGILDHLYNGQPMLTVGAPLEANGQIIGGVYVSQPIPEIRDTYENLFSQLIIIILVALLFSMILFYLISKTITTPIHQINSAVTEFSKGDFSRRVEYEGTDELGELSANINNMATSLANLENMRSSFISDVSHELRTPMTSISGFVEGILDGTIEESEKDRYLEIVLSESKRLSRLVTDLLSLTRMENSDVQVNYSQFDINDLTCQALIKFEKFIDEKNIEVEMNIPDEKIIVGADKDAITQVLINLLNNAVKFTPDGGTVSVRIWCHQTRCYVEIKNTGDGIPPDKLKYIWDRFYKLDSSRSADKSGFGLGLYIVKSIIAKHDEKIWVDSKEGEFTSFTFSLTLDKQ